MIWIGILVYTDPAGLRTYLTSQVTEQSPLGDTALPPMPVPGGVLPAGDPKVDLSVFPSEPVQLSENQTQQQQREQKAGLEQNQHSWAQGAQGRGNNGQVELGTEAEVTWGAEDEEIWRKLSFRHWPALFSYYNITLAKRQVGWRGVPRALGCGQLTPGVCLPSVLPSVLCAPDSYLVLWGSFLLCLGGAAEQLPWGEQSSQTLQGCSSGNQGCFSLSVLLGVLCAWCLVSSLCYPGREV